MPRLDERRLSEQHFRVWRALDRLARGRGMSPSGLAKAAGLDPTAFNPSKRVTREGKLRWPGMETLAKAAAAADVSLRDVAQLIDSPSDAIGLLAAPFSRAVFDAAGRPISAAWAPLEPLATTIPHAEHFAVALEDDRAAPIFRAGDWLVCAPYEPPRVGDRALAAPADGPAQIVEISALGEAGAELEPICAAAPVGRALTESELAVLAPIVWVRTSRR